MLLAHRIGDSPPPGRRAFDRATSGPTPNDQSTTAWAAWAVRWNVVVRYTSESGPSAPDVELLQGRRQRTVAVIGWMPCIVNVWMQSLCCWLLGWPCCQAVPGPSHSR